MSTLKLLSDVILDTWGQAYSRVRASGVVATYSLMVRM